MPSLPQASSAQPAPAHPHEGCHIDIHVHCGGDVHIHNCAGPASPGTQPPQAPPACAPCTAPTGSCLPAVAGAKHKRSRSQKLARLAQGQLIPSAIAAATVHLIRRHQSGRTAANALEAKAFAILDQLPSDTLACTLAGFDQTTTTQRDRIFAPALNLGIDQDLDEQTLTAAVARELKQRISLASFGDPLATEAARPGRVRVYEPQDEDFFTQVRICKLNGLRTFSQLPALPISAYRPDEIQHDCRTQVVDGSAEVTCQVRTTDCPGNSLGGACARVPPVAQGDGVMLEGVNFFSTDARVRLIDRATGNLIRDVPAFVHGDWDTPVTEIKNGQPALINDCRVHDKLSFQVPADLPVGVFQIQVVVPNISGIASLGAEMLSNGEYIEVVPPATARFSVVAEKIWARRPTSPAWIGSDEVGLHTLGFPLFADGTLGTEEDQVTEQTFQEIRDVDFDPGTQRDITRVIFQHDRPIMGMFIAVRGDEIDNQRVYDRALSDWSELFIEHIQDQLKYLVPALAALGGIAALSSMSTVGWILAGCGALLLLAYDAIWALWAPADPIIRDSISLSATELMQLTSVEVPALPVYSFAAEDGIAVTVGKPQQSWKQPLQYRETREYLSDAEDSNYVLGYRFNRVA